MTAPATNTTWPGTVDGWRELLEAMRDRAHVVFGGYVAELVRRDVAINLRILCSVEPTPDGRLTPEDARSLEKLFGPLIDEVRAQSEQGTTRPIPDREAADLFDDALTDLLVRAAPTNLAGAGTHVVGYLRDHNAALHPIGGETS